MRKIAIFSLILMLLSTSAFAEWRAKIVRVGGLEQDQVEIDVQYFDNDAKETSFTKTYHLQVGNFKTKDDVIAFIKYRLSDVNDLVTVIEDAKKELDKEIVNVKELDAVVK